MSRTKTEEERRLHTRKHCPICFWCADTDLGAAQKVVAHMAHVHARELAVREMQRIIRDSEGAHATLDG